MNSAIEEVTHGIGNGIFKIHHVIHPVIFILVPQVA